MYHFRLCITIRRSKRALTRGIVVLILAFSNLSAVAQKMNASPLSITEESISMLTDSLQWTDSTLTDFQTYQPLLFAQDLGNYNSPYRFMYLKQPSNIGFNTGWFTPTNYFYDLEHATYYKAKVPYTYASYASGQRPSNSLDILQQVKLLHTQNWGPLFNIGVRMVNNRCNGFSTNAQARTSSGNIFMWFHSPNNKYQMVGNTIFSSASNQLNGGIINDSSYENSSGVSREIAGLLADSSLFRYKSRQYNIRHFYRFGHESIRLVSRAVRRDSIVTDTIKNIEANLQLGHSITYTREAWVYQDNIKYSEKYYRNYYFDSLRTKDTLHQNTVSNIIDLTYKSKKLGLIYAAYENKLHWIYSLSSTNLMNESILRGSIQDTFKNRLFLKLKSSYCLFNNFDLLSQGDHLTEMMAHLNLKSFKVKATALFAMQSPTLLQVYFPGNHFYWYTPDLAKTKTTTGTIEITSTSNKSSVQFTSSQITNYTYFDSSISPLQARTLRYSAVQWKEDLKVGVLHYLHQAILQQSTNEYAMPIPKILLKATLMYDDEWFKKALRIQIGVTANYFSQYYAPAFMPSVNLFYSQSYKKIGNYPQLDAFVNLQIQRVRIFVTMEHANQGMQGFTTATYITPHYPIPNRAFRFGVSWSFYN